jgi:hypothetical protein
VKSVSYSSLAAFLAHWRAVCAAAEGRVPQTNDDADTLNTMNGLLGALSREERDLLMKPSRRDGGTERRRQRAESKLRRILTTGGILRD